MKIKLVLLIISIITITVSSCNKDDEGDISTTGTIKVSTTVEGYGAISGVNVSIVETSTDAYIQEKTTNSEGKVEFTSVTAGTYYIDCDYILNDPDDVDYEEHIGESNDFQLIAGETKTITVVLD